MAESPSHKLGQFIGEVLESVLREDLAAVAAARGLYLDYQHPRPARGGKRKVGWTDFRGNHHDLDYVLEEGGSEQVRGRPKAFIESAWRRYTKHSRNKAQEIQGAVSPLAETYADEHPFLGVVLGGVFTDGSLSQLRSHRFHILYFPYESIVNAFAVAGVDIGFGEDTSEEDLKSKVRACAALSGADKARIVARLRVDHASELKAVLGSLATVLDRRVVRVHVLPLFGDASAIPTVGEAIDFLVHHDAARPEGRFDRYEVMVSYNNGDEIRGSFQAKDPAIEFLQGFL